MKLHQVTLPAVDLAESVAFYERLGLRLIVLAAPRYARFETPHGETLSLHVVPEDALGGSAGRAVVYLEVGDVDGVHEELVARGVHFERAPRDERWLWREARLTDPAGNPLRLFRAGRNRRFPPWRIEGDDGEGVAGSTDGAPGAGGGVDGAAGATPP